jgi:hypothetical protein
MRDPEPTGTIRPVDNDLRDALRHWLSTLDQWLQHHGVTRLELLELWEEVAPTTPVDPGST